MYEMTNIYVLLLRLFADVAGSGSGSQNSLGNYGGYYDKFITRNNTKVTAQKGGMAILPCTVRLTSPATVSQDTRQMFLQKLIRLSSDALSKYLVSLARKLQKLHCTL